MARVERSDIPVRPEELDPAWLSVALRSSGWIDGGNVVAVERQILGAGEGFLGVIARLALRFEGERSAPDSVIAKLPTFVQENRLMGELMGAYWREICFYRELADQVPVRTPKLYYADLDPDPAREKQEQIVAQLDRLPLWFARSTMPLARFIARRKAHRYVLLIEDFSAARLGDQVGGGGIADCRRVLLAIAAVHAAFWQSGRLEKLWWLARQDANPRIRHGMYLQGRPAFERRYATRMEADPDLVRAIRWLDANGIALARALHGDAPCTLLHCDLRLDNVFFEEGEGADGVILCDWQLTGCGAAGYDVAYLVSGALDRDVTHEQELALLREYHDALCNGGVEEYPYNQLLRDYERGLLAVLQVISSTDNMDLGEDRGITLMDLWLERTVGRIRNLSLDKL